MKVACVEYEGQVMVAVSQVPEQWRLLNPDAGLSSLRSVKALIALGRRLDESQLLKSSRVVDTSELNFLAPIQSPEKIICVGKNYEDHAKEMGSEKPELPVIFNKLPSCLVGNNQPVVLPPISSKVDYEGELVVVIGREGGNIPREEAMDFVFGYTVGNDISARDWQKGRPGGQWLLGKAFDTFAPLGPWIVTADEIDDPGALKIELRLNDEVMQSASTDQMIFSIDYLIWHLSKFFTLRPGDLLFTGTPAGVGAGRVPEVYLSSGDVMTVCVESIGELTNPVI